MSNENKQTSHKQDEDFIRKMVLCDEGAFIRTLILTEDQVKLVFIVQRNGSLTSSELAQVKDISVQSAYARLNRLYLSGYLNMIERSAATGGYERIYTMRELR